ncbi:uncharacterized protein LOC116777003 isoform X2 [Danaus plexippus]|nr:uncharacterized protein LOC116777003 isoform X2 [Danaus plexippus]
MFRSIPEWVHRTRELYMENARMLFAISSAYMNGGRVDSHWTTELYPSKQYYASRVQFYRNTVRENIEIYKRIKNAAPRVVPTNILIKEWNRNKIKMIKSARNNFVLFPTSPVDLIEDSAFKAPDGANRPRVYIHLRARGHSSLGYLRLELFTDACPLTCGLFLELMMGDGLGHGYVGTRFFRKVPHLFWSGGDVIYDAGVGCYAQRGRSRPIGAENYHFPHSMPGLLSMRMTGDDEMCGIFNITFKALPQFDLRNVVFGRVIRPCPTFDVIQTLPANPHPAIEIASARFRLESGWVCGARNARIRPTHPTHVPRPRRQQ